MYEPSTSLVPAQLMCGTRRVHRNERKKKKHWTDCNYKYIYHYSTCEGLRDCVCIICSYGCLVSDALYSVFNGRISVRAAAVRVFKQAISIKERLSPDYVVVASSNRISDSIHLTLALQLAQFINHWQRIKQWFGVDVQQLLELTNLPVPILSFHCCVNGACKITNFLISLSITLSMAGNNNKSKVQIRSTMTAAKTKSLTYRPIRNHKKS